jgi:hypothetical protein
MKLAFLKKRKIPRVADKPQEEKLINASSSDHLEDHCLDELFEAAENKNIQRFRAAVEAFVLNQFDFDGEQNG